MLTCKDVIGLLLDYLEASLTPDLRTDLERHLSDCAPCVAYINTYRKTLELTGEATRVPMPEDMKARLRQFLLEHLGKGSL